MLRGALFRRWELWLFLLLAVVIAVLGARDYTLVTRQYRAAAASELQAIAELKTAQIVRWRDERIGDARLLMNGALLPPAVLAWLESPSAEGSAQLLTVFAGIRDNLGYANVTLIDPMGGELLSLEPAAAGLQEPLVQAAIARAFAERAPQFTELHRHQDSAAPHFAVVLPLFVWQETTMQPRSVAMVLDIDPTTYLYPLLAEWPTPSRSAEAVLVSQNEDAVQFLSGLPLIGAPPLSYTLPLTATRVAAVQAVQGVTGLVEAVDYRGTEVLAYLASVPDSPWRIVVKIDRSEIYADLPSRLLGTVSATALGVLSVLLLALLSWRERERRYLRDLYHAQTELEAKTAQIETFFEYSAGLLCIGTYDGKFVRVNNAWTDQLGWTPAQIAGRPFTDFIHPDDVALTEEELARLAQGDPILDLVTRFRHTDGSYHWLEWRSVPYDQYLYTTARDITAERQAAEKLRISEARLRLAADLSNLVIAVSDRDLRYTWVYNAELFGVGPDAVLGRREDEVVGGDVDLTIVDLRRQVMETGQRVRQELWWMVNGERRVYDTILEPTLDDGGAVVGMTVVAQDITARKRMEDALRHSEEQYRQLVESSHQGMAIGQLDPLRIAFASTPLAKMTGYTVDELTALTPAQLYELIHPDDRARFFDVLEAIIFEREVNAYNRYRVIHRDGHDVWMEIHSIHTEFGGKPAVQAVFLDVSEQIKAEEALRASEAMYRLLTDNARDLIYRIRLQPEVCFEYVSPSVTELTGYTPEDHYADPQLGFRLVHPDDRHLLQVVTEQVHDEPIVMRWVRKDGSTVWTEQINTLVRDESGAVIAIEGIARDITDRMQAAEALRRSEERLRLAVDVAGLTVANVDRDLRYTWLYNPHTAFDDKSSLGKRDDELVDPANAAGIMALKRQALETGQPVHGEFTVMLPDGEHIYDFVVEPTLDDAGAVVSLTTAGQEITARKRMEAALRLSEGQLRLAADLVGMTIATVDRDLRYTWVYNSAPNMPGPDARLGRRDDEIFGAENAARAMALRRQVLETKQRVHAENALELPVGRRYFDVIYDPIFDDKGEVTGMLGVGIDITERKEAAEALQRSEEMYRLLADNAGDVIYRVRLVPKTAFEYMSPSVLAITGYPPEAFYADPQLGTRLLHPEDRPLLSATIANASERPLVTRWLRQDGAVIWLEQTSSFTRDETGRVIAFQGIARDITERKQAEEALRRSEEQLRLQTEQILRIIESVPEGVLLLDPDGRIMLANPRVQEDMHGVVDVRVGELLTQLGDSSLDELVAVDTDEWREVRLADRIFETAARPLAADDVLQGWVLVLRDVTMERAAQAAYQRQEQLAAVGQLAAGIAHDFNNILAVISLYTELLLHSPRLNDKERERLNTILRQSRDAAELVQQILDFSRQAVLERRALDLDVFVAEQVAMLRRTLPESIEIKFAAPAAAQGHIVYADRTRLAQLILNLATNARDAMPDGGALRLSLATMTVRPDDAATHPNLEPGDWIVLTVRDTGTGIEPQHLSRLFNPFFTTKAPGKGTGLGLAQVYGIVKQHGGFIDVASQLGQGTTFTIYLPRSIAHAPVAAPGAGAVVRGHGETLLLVEDEDDVRAALADTLRTWGYEVVEAANGEEALSALDALARPVRLILSDVVMPVMGGIRLVEILRARGYTLPVVLLTGHPLGDGPEKLAEGLVSAWLLKPPDVHDLSRTLAQALTPA